MTKQERESMLYDEFDKFTSEPGESIHSYYLRYAKLINDMTLILYVYEPMQDQHEVCGIIFQTQVELGRQSHGYAGQASEKNQASGARVINTVGNAGANQLRVVRRYKCNGEGHIAKQCTTKKRVKDSEWFKDKMLLAQAQEAGVVLNEEQHDFLADSLEETDDYEDFPVTKTTTNFKAGNVLHIVSRCDDEATTNAIFMEFLSPVGSLNDDTDEPCYDSDMLSEVPYYDIYHDSDMLNSNIQELGYIENIVSNKDSYNKLTSNINVISYTDYMLTIRNDEDNYVPPPV
ncbi:retrovirus-related pol polyprotein from transposon TNT 1-94 [Tanacetum coccineum]